MLTETSLLSLLSGSSMQSRNNEGRCCTMKRAELVGSLVGSALLAVAMPVAALADTASDMQDAPQPQSNFGQAESQGTVSPVLQHIMLDNVYGVFSANQDPSMTNTALSKALYRGSRALCGAGVGVEDLAGPTGTGETVGDTIAVSGNVSHAFKASISNYEKKAPVRKVLGCTCLGTPSMVAPARMRKSRDSNCAPLSQMLTRYPVRTPFASFRPMATRYFFPLRTSCSATASS